ncbi:uncharacterized protein LOC127791466 [Diospyros lotus]|uniref:uncharacterized protein LOC127791466 n=1 Tax=Diospyros lotus TaxID=55363 RepID=UPI0022565D11|nr:uncharacterized protein LOC127791466 [Diospyros lotus]
MQWSKLGKVMKEAWDGSMIAARFLCLLHITDNYLCSASLVYGPSMLPTLNLTGDVILVDRVSTRLGKVGLGDLVLVQSPLNPRMMVTKRIVGMEGDAVSFLVDPVNSDRFQTLVVPKGHAWIQGDNIYSSRDSRHYGPVPYGLIRGKVWFRVWPPDGFGSL